MHLVVGLGNPGKRYERTRHNVGFLVADRLAVRCGTAFDGKQFKADVAKAQVAGKSAVLAKPQTFMNLSGDAVASLAGYYKTPPEEMVVVYDEVDLPFGTIRVKSGGGAGGHNGIKDVLRVTRGGDFVRVRFGISRPPEGWDTADYVLSTWTTTEAEQLDDLVDRAADAVETVIREGHVSAMNQFNVRGKDGPGAPPGAPSQRASEGS